MAVQPPSPTSSADGVAWDLSALYAGVDDAKLEADLDAAQRRAEAFEQRYRGQVADLDAAKLHEAVAELQDIHELMDASGIYAHLLHAAKSDEPAFGRLVSFTQERATAIRRHLLFFELEWIEVDDDAARALMADERLQAFAYLLERERRAKPHRRAEGEEHILDETSNTGSRAWSRLFDEITGRLSVDITLDGETRTLNESEVLALLYDPDRETRRAAAAALTVTLRREQHPLTYIFNVRLQDHSVGDRIRAYPTPMAARNLANEIEQQAVDALAQAVRAGYPIVQRYYRLKQRMLGLDELFDYDRYAPLTADLPAYDWDAAKRISLDSYAGFSDTLGDIVARAFDERWIDAELRVGKRGGAFSAGATTAAHPYILCNFTDRIRDVMTVAHELGHAVHQHLSRDVGYLQAHTPLTTAETASVFGELLVFRRLLSQQSDQRARLALLASKIEDTFATVFRQISMHEFERAAHRARRDEGELTAQRIGELWIDANAPMHGGSVTLTDDYRVWWSYIPHFIHTPFYVYAYAFGELLVLALVDIYDQQGPAFAPAYVEMLRKGGSVSPVELVRPLGIDLDDADFWTRGVRLIDAMVTEAEDLADGLA